jgi:hypothetical protein
MILVEPETSPERPGGLTKVKDEIISWLADGIVVVLKLLSHRDAYGVMEVERRVPVIQSKLF